MTFNSHVVARFGRLYIDLDRVRAAHHLAEEALVRHDKRVDEWFAENLARDPNDAELISYLHAEQKDDAARGYPQVLRSSLFVTSYAFLELFMTGLCKEIKKHVSGPDLNDLRGEGIQRARLFLTSVAAIDFPDTTEWQRLLLYGKLRNVIVHAQGELAEHASLPAVKQLRAQEKTFELSDDASTIILHDSFNPRLLDIVQTFSQQLNLNVSAYIGAS